MRGPERDAQGAEARRGAVVLRFLFFAGGGKRPAAGAAGVCWGSFWLAGLRVAGGLDLVEVSADEAAYGRFDKLAGEGCEEVLGVGYAVGVELDLFDCHVVPFCAVAFSAGPPARSRARPGSPGPDRAAPLEMPAAAKRVVCAWPGPSSQGKLRV